MFFFSGCFCDILIRGRIRPERKYYVTKIICFFQERAKAQEQENKEVEKSKAHKKWDVEL